jgi:site-specific recombinase XerD
MKSKWSGYKSFMADHITAFLAYKRALARKFHTEDTALRLFDRYLFENDIGHLDNITPLLIEVFLASRPRKSPRSYNHLLGVIRRFFSWLVVQGILDSSPVKAHTRRATTKRQPFLFGLSDAKKLLAAADNLPDNSRAPLRGPTYSMIFALLYGLGLRVGEASRLCVKDVDLGRCLLVIRETKFAKSRLVPFGPLMAKKIETYLSLRGELKSDSSFFSFNKHRPVHPGTISQTFHHLLPILNLNIPAGVHPPRLHDLRHAFATGTLLRWYRAGIDPASRLIHLSTFLGHVSPSSTAVYLSITPDLLDQANERFERLGSAIIKEVSI